MSSRPATVSENRDEKLPLTFTVSRRDKGQINQFPASETTALLPGDVVRVVQPRIADGPSQAAPGLPGRDTPQSGKPVKRAEHVWPASFVPDGPLNGEAA